VVAAQTHVFAVDGVHIVELDAEAACMPVRAGVPPGIVTRVPAIA
jgi:hypothetical protein